MPMIEVDFDVFKAITARRPTEDVTENDVLRQLFGLSSLKDGSSPHVGRPSPGDWVSKGVRFPQGTQLRATYKGQTYLAEVAEGALIFQGQRYESPSAAAMAISKSPVNGWAFWEAKFPGRAAWQPLKDLKRRVVSPA